MIILLDIVHMADVNFFKKAISLLKEHGHQVIITCTDRGNLVKVLRKEINPVSLKVIGIHSKGKFIAKSIKSLARVGMLRKYIRQQKPDVVASFGYYPAAATYGTKVRSLAFHDDKEYWQMFSLCKLFAKKFVIPSFVSTSGRNIVKYHSYKEWAYLSPKYFSPSNMVLDKYGLKENKYIFARIVARISLNYSNQDIKELSLSKLAADLKKKGLKLVVSLEDKSIADKLKGCIILEEPVDDIYSLIFHSLAMLTSGDTMAREAALLGVPSFYLGGRNMEINKDLIKNNLMHIIAPDEIEKHLLSLTAADKKISRLEAAEYTKNLDDATMVIVRALEGDL